MQGQAPDRAPEPSARTKSVMREQAKTPDAWPNPAMARAVAIFCPRASAAGAVSIRALSQAPIHTGCSSRSCFIWPAAPPCWARSCSLVAEGDYAHVWPDPKRRRRRPIWQRTISPLIFNRTRVARLGFSSQVCLRPRPHTK
jgi:hypothetical protein